jgi:hypothetical protein
VVFYVFYFTYRLPSESLDWYLKILLGWFGKERYYFFPLLLSLVFSVSVNFYQKITYCKEINRLVELRSLLMHGVENKELNQLENHSASRFDLGDA